ncbi:MAG TPA: hypothetical protein VF212_00890 [Longimicrobiales bacterium]
MAVSAAPLPMAPPEPAARAAATPWTLYAALFGATSIAVGVEWDISWHKTIGRDTLWTPAHLAIYLGGIVAGAAGGWRVLRTTFGRDAPARAASVRFWGFRGPLGAWACIWGAFAMVTSAPFDDWWHNAYGLDVKILSPPHTVLALGIVAILLGALFLAASHQNRGGGPDDVHRSRLLFAYAAGLLVEAAAIMTTEFTHRVYMHGSLFYRVVCAVFPFFIVAGARASALRWPATTITAVYSAVRLSMVWLLPLFPAEPRLGPIFQDIDHMVPLDFPLLLIVPAAALDVALRRGRDSGRAGRRAIVLGAAFFATFVPAQWVFADFLQSPASANWIFATDNHFYGMPPDAYAARRLYVPTDADARAALAGMAVALLLAVASARLGLWWGAWMARVRR